MCSLQRAAASPSPEYKFSTMDQEKIMLVEKMCQLKKELVKQEEKAEFFEEHIAQLTEEIQGKSRYDSWITACILCNLGRVVRPSTPGLT